MVSATHAMRARWVAFGGGAISTLIALTNLVLARLDVVGGNSLSPNLALMRANTALGVIACGSALMLLSGNIRTRWRFLVGGLAVAVMTLAGLTLAETIFGRDLGIDHWFYPPGWAASGRITPAVSFCLLLVSGALLDLARPAGAHRKRSSVPALATTLLIISVLAWLGTLSNSLVAARVWNFAGMVPPAATSFFAFGLGLLALEFASGRLNWSLDRATSAGFGAGIAIIIIAGAISYHFTGLVHRDMAWINQTQEVLREIDSMQAATEAMKSAQRGFILMGRDELLATRSAEEASAWKSLAHLRRLTDGNPDRQSRLADIEEKLKRRIAWEDETIRVRRTQGTEAASQLIRTNRGVALLSELKDALGSMKEEEHIAVGRGKTKSAASSSAAFLLLPLGIFLSLTLLMLGLFSLNTGFRERLDADARLKASFKDINDLRAALDEHAIVTTADPEGRIVAVNDKFCATSKYPREELIGQDHRIVNSGHHSKEFMRNLWTTIARGYAWHGELKNRAKDGSLHWLDTTIVPILGANGSPRQYVAISADITARKLGAEALRESEERLRQMAENIDEAFWMIDPDRNAILYMSPAYEKIWGRSRKEIYAKPEVWLDTVAPEDRQRMSEASARVRSAGEYIEEYRITRPDGTIRWVRGRAFPIRDAAGHIYRIVGVADDITEAKQLEEQFLRAQRMEAIGTLAGGMAHDLNNILGPVLMISDLLKSKLSGKTDRDLIAMLENCAQRGSGIIRQLLMFSRGVSGERVGLELRHLVKDMGALMRETFPREIAIEEILGDQIRSVTGDATQLHQVLMNLCVNARDAMPAGGRLKIELANVDVDYAMAQRLPGARPGKFVCLSVTDTGEGMPPAIITRIFDPFFTTKEIGKGTGLGLSTVLGIVKSHGGFLGVESVVNVGSTFRIYLPANDSGDARAAAKPEQIAEGNGELILVVDDEIPICEATRRTLEDHNYHVLIGHDGRQGLQLYLEHEDEVRLVLTDLMMPILGGIALVRSLRAITSELPIIATTGLDQKVSQDELASLGVTEVLIKPCSPVALRLALRRELDRRPKSSNCG